MSFYIGTLSVLDNESIVFFIIHFQAKLHLSITVRKKGRWQRLHPGSWAHSPLRARRLLARKKRSCSGAPAVPWGRVFCSPEFRSSGKMEDDATVKLVGPSAPPTSSLRAPDLRESAFMWLLLIGELSGGAIYTAFGLVHTVEWVRGVASELDIAYIFKDILAVILFIFNILCLVIRRWEGNWILTLGILSHFVLLGISIATFLADIVLVLLSLQGREWLEVSVTALVMVISGSNLLHYARIYLYRT